MDSRRSLVNYFHHRISITLLTCLFLAATALPVLAQWVEDGLLICDESSEQYYVRTVPDGEGGAIVAWRDFRNGNFDIYAQRVNEFGIPLWTSNGVAVCTYTGNQSSVEMISDGAGGAIITWQDSRNGNPDVYAQRIDASGAPLWTVNGVAICTDPANVGYPLLTTDGAGGAIITWMDYRSVSINDVFAQRIDSLGNTLWTANGILACTYSSNQSNPAIAEDEFGGAHIAWVDNRNGNYDIYCQRLNGNGLLLGGNDGVAVCTASYTQTAVAIISDGAGGAIYAWEDYRSGNNYDIYALRINSAWIWAGPGDGVAICSNSAHQRDPVMISDGNTGAIIAWADQRGTYYDIYAQRVSALCSPLWTADGVVVSAADISQEQPEIISDGLGGAIVAWRDYRYLTTYDIYAQRLDENGAVVWATDGVAVSTALSDQHNVSIASDGNYGAIFAFTDYRNFGADITVQRIERNGYWGYPAPVITGVRDIPGDEGGYVNLSWDASRLDIYPQSAIQEYTVWRAIDETAAMAMLDRGALLMESEFDFMQMDNGALALADEDKTIPTDERPVIRRSVLGSETYYWIHVSTIAASDYTDHYADVVATLFDSTATSSELHYFQVIAHESAPTGFWISSTDSGYSVDNLAPCPPLCLAGEQSYVPEGLTLTWAPNEEIDLDFYVIYRGLSDDFTPSPGNLIASPCDTMHFDGEWRWDDGYCYKVAAVDVHGNESEYALLCSDNITGEETPVTPLATYLEQNFPNPFNPSTRIAFGINEPGRVSLRIYDAAGRLVRTLINEEREAGVYSEAWNGRDNVGSAVASGIYFYNLTAGSFKETKKMVLLR